MVRYLFYTIGDLTYQTPLVETVFFYYVCTGVLHILVAGLLARSQYPEGPATDHLGTGFSWFSYV